MSVLTVYDPALTPVRTHELVEALRDRLQASALVVDGGEAGVFDAQLVVAHEEPKGFARQVASRARILVRERVEIGGRRRRFTGHQSVPVQVLVRTSPTFGARQHRVGTEPTGRASLASFHAELHARIHRALVGFKPSLGSAEGVIRVRQDREPTPPSYNPQVGDEGSMGVNESLAEYTCVLQATEAT